MAESSLNIALPGSPEKKQESRDAEKVLRLLAHKLRPFGFSRTKRSFFTKPRTFIVEFVHIHKFRFGPVFRLHLGIRVRNEHSSAAHLNGLAFSTTSEFQNDSELAYAFRFNSDPSSFAACAESMAQVVGGQGLKWFNSYDQGALCSPDSPLTVAAREALQIALQDPRQAVASAETIRLFNVD